MGREKGREIEHEEIYVLARREQAPAGCEIESCSRRPLSTATEQAAPDTFPLWPFPWLRLVAVVCVRRSSLRSRRSIHTAP